MLEMSVLILVVLATLVSLLLGYLAGSWISAHKTDRLWEEKVPELRQDAIARSRANLGGKFSESLAPYFPDFPFHPTEMRWLGGSPVDFVAFKGLDDNNIKEIIFVEIKSGQSQLTAREKQIKEVIEQKKISWQLYRAPEEVTKVK